MQMKVSSSEVKVSNQIKRIMSTRRGNEDKKSQKINKIKSLRNECEFKETFFLASSDCQERTTNTQFGARENNKKKKRGFPVYRVINTETQKKNMNLNELN